MDLFFCEIDLKVGRIGRGARKVVKKKERKEYNILMVKFQVVCLQFRAEQKF